MNKTYKVLIAALSLFLLVMAAGCAKTEQATGTTSTETKPTKVSNIIHTSLNNASPYHAFLVANPDEVKAGAPASLIFTVKDAKGAIVKDLQVVHEKPMHLLVVSSDLAEFNHLHPEPQSDGTLKVSHTFPHGGGYKLYVDFTPPGSNQAVDSYDLTVGGKERPREALAADATPAKTVESLKVAMSSDKPLRAGEDVLLNFAVADAQTGKPVTDLQEYLGAMAHFVIISEDTTEFIHAHPMGAEEMDMGAKTMKTGGDVSAKNVKPTVTAHTKFTSSGLYKIWAQFQRGEKVITVPFVVRVGEGGQGNVASKGESNSAAPAGAIKVTVSGAGFEPEQIKVRKGESVQLAFYRADEKNCASEVVFPSLGIKKALPVGKTTLVEVTMKDSGEINFGCGMGMFKGALVATN